MKCSRILTLFTVVLVVIALQACGGGSSSSSTQTGAAQVSLTDAPGDFDHVWITVKDIWFHTSDAAGPNDPGWLKYPLANPVTIDLLTLSNGVVSNANALWGNITLPIGNYQQIRIFLARTEDTLTASASAHSLQWNNEVQISSTGYPLHIPDALNGIKLNGSFQVENGGTLRLAIDFDAGNDVILLWNSEYILKPRLTYFDLDHAGAIVGQINLTSAPSSTVHFVVKAETLSNDGTYHIVNRYTVVNLASAGTSTFVLYPLSALSSTQFDIVIRGVGYETSIIKNIPVTKGTTPAVNPTTIPQVTMIAGSDYAVLGNIDSPTGAWVNFYQTLSGTGTTEVPYEIRFTHFHPLTGAFANFELSNSQIRYGTYNGSNPVAFTAVNPAEGVGGYQAVADAIRYQRPAMPGVPVYSSPTQTSYTFPDLVVDSSLTQNQISGTIDMSSFSKYSSLTSGYVFAVSGGMIVNSVDAGSTMKAGGKTGTYTISKLPGGYPGAFYAVEAIGWDTSDFTIRTIAFPPGLANLSPGTDVTGITMNMIAF